MAPEQIRIFGGIVMKRLSSSRKSLRGFILIIFLCVVLDILGLFDDARGLFEHDHAGDSLFTFGAFLAALYGRRCFAQGAIERKILAMVGLAFLLDSFSSLILWKAQIVSIAFLFSISAMVCFLIALRSSFLGLRDLT